MSRRCAALYRGLEHLVDRWLAEGLPVPPPSEPARQIRDIDGMPGALFVFGHLGPWALSDAGFWDDALLREAARG